ncbi:major facilitator transporter [Burkholderia diffusa]|uniref:Major facilitator transporter n=1 Tax=Burkholderia diffusa TaxID=488732 RepID=A0A6P2N0F2_9BURK|nr:major facilitator transporter [Burkholderia diffusa]
MTRAARFQPLLLRCALLVAGCASIAAAHVARISTCIIGANYVTSTGWVIAFMTIAFFSNGFASITWPLVFNLTGNLVAIATPIVIGLLVDGADFSRAITYIAAMALEGSLSYGLLVGKVERIDA